MYESKFVKFFTWILKWQVNSSSDFSSFFSVITLNSFVNFKLVHLLIWAKGSYQSPNFDTFECSGESLPNSKCPNRKSVFLQIFHHSSLSWKITPLYFFRSNVIYFAAQKGTIKKQFFETWVLGKKLTKFLNSKLVFLQILYFHIYIICIYIFVVIKFIYFQQKESIKVQIWWDFSWAVESLKSSTLMGFDDIRYLVNFHPTTKKSQNFTLMGSFCSR